MDKPETPNLDKMLEVTEESNKIGAFLNWLREDQELLICEPTEDVDNWYSPVYSGISGINRLLAEYYGIDYDEMENERRAILEYAREQNELGSIQS